jgi:putative flippase GtrA
MLTFLKAQAAAIIGSLVDFLVYALLVQLTGNTPAMVSLATAEGAVCGGVVNFLIIRTWVFNEGQNKKHVQVMRYILVWAGSILLNSSGMYLITYFTTINYAIARILVSVLVGVFYNYFLQKRFVFK